MKEGVNPAKVWKWVKRGIAAVEAMDIADRFMSGWNSVECSN